MPDSRQGMVFTDAAMQRIIGNLHCTTDLITFPGEQASTMLLQSRYTLPVTNHAISHGVYPHVHRVSHASEA